MNVVIFSNKNDFAESQTIYKAFAKEKISVVITQDKPHPLCPNSGTLEKLETTLKENHYNSKGILCVCGQACLAPWIIQMVCKNKHNFDGLVFSRNKINHLDSIVPVANKNGRLINVNENQSHEQYYGIMFLADTIVQELFRFSQTEPEISVFSMVQRISSNFNIQVVNVFREHIMQGKKILGGSYAKSRVVKHFNKEAQLAGRRKLRDEIRFLCNLPKTLQTYYPKVYRHEETNDRIFLEQEYIDFPNFRELLFQGHLTIENAKSVLKILFKTIFENLYTEETTACPSNYLDQYHFLRVGYRIKQTLKRAPVFLDIVTADKIILNDIEYWNIPAILLFMQSSHEIREAVMPEYVSPYVHGDLHLGNILVDPLTHNFKLVDPRGYSHCDPYYDFGKLSHSTNGKYDFLHQDLFALEYTSKKNVITAQLKYANLGIINLYDKLNDEIFSYLSKSSQYTNGVIKTLFAEAMHFCSDMPFHLQDDRVENRSIAIYLTGVKQLNEVLKKIGCDFDGHHWIQKAKGQIESYNNIEWKNAG